MLASYRVLLSILSEGAEGDEVLTLLRIALAEPLQQDMQAYLTRRFGIDPHRPETAFAAVATHFKARGGTALWPGICLRTGRAHCAGQFRQYSPLLLQRLLHG
jgi:hypothetical protein